MCCCCSKKSLHIATLDNIYYKTKEYPAFLPSNTQIVTTQAVEELKVFVKDRVRPVNDYLENNQRKLKSVGSYMSEKCRSSTHPVDHLISLFILNNILPAIKNYSYDRGDMVKLINKARKGKDVESASVRGLLNKNLAENYLIFEESMIEIIDVLIAKENPFGSLNFIQDH
jgi:hypothetical protein